jgi:hypothetical protein
MGAPKRKSGGSLNKTCYGHYDNTEQTACNNIERKMHTHIHTGISHQGSGKKTEPVPSAEAERDKGCRGKGGIGMA